MSESFITKYESPFRWEEKWHKAIYGRISDNPLSNLFIDLFIIGQTLEFVEDPRKVKAKGLPEQILERHAVLELKEFKKKLELKLGKHVNACFQAGDSKKIRSLEKVAKTVTEKFDTICDGDFSNDVMALSFVEDMAMSEKRFTRYCLREHFESKGRVLSDDQFYGIIKRLDMGPYFVS
ncbi:hypothetical protein N8603_00840 [Verrucomicrobiales bacterium]|nr:hypothetical protein [Verrucomicrobiales bacterium]